MTENEATWNPPAPGATAKRSRFGEIVVKGGDKPITKLRTAVTRDDGVVASKAPPPVTPARWARSPTPALARSPMNARSAARRTGTSSSTSSELKLSS